MLHFTFSTVLMALIASSLIIALISAVFLHSKTMVCTGYKLLGAFVGLTIFRMFFPFELPFAANIYFSHNLSRAISFFLQPQIHFFNTAVSIWNIFEAVWIVGIIYKFILIITDYRHTQDYILKYGQEFTEDLKYKTILDTICAQHNRKNNFHVLKLPNISVPFIFGLKTPYIVLPKELSITADDLYYVLYHEAMHHFHHDLLIKGLLCILSIIYWWNPLFSILYKQTNTLLEMNIDGLITHKEQDITVEYASSLLNIKKKTLECTSPIPHLFKKDSCFLIQPQDKDLKKRFSMLLCDFAAYKKVSVKIILTLLITGVYLASYVVIFEAYYHPPQLYEKPLIVPDKDNTYFIKIDEHHYEVYLYGIYAETVDSLDSYSDKIKIYNKEGELINEN